jgi:hypothetical protein
MRTSDCTLLQRVQLLPYVMSAAETATFDLQPIEMRQVMDMFHLACEEARRIENVWL